MSRRVGQHSSCPRHRGGRLTYVSEPVYSGALLLKDKPRKTMLRLPKRRTQLVRQGWTNPRLSPADRLCNQANKSQLVFERDQKFF